MDIALIAPPWLPVPPTSYGGTEAAIDALARGLAASGHHVVLVGHPASACPVELRAVDLAVEQVGIGQASHELAHALHAYSMVGDADIVHDHTLAGPLLAPEDRLYQLVATNHGPFDHVLGPLFERISSRAAVVAISNAHAASTDVPTTVIHHGLDVREHPAGLGGDDLVFLGRMAPEKGVRTAIEVARRSGRKLVIAAKMREAAERRYFEHHVEPLLGGGVEYVGEVDQETKLRLLAGAAALVNPIAWPEPFGMVMLEAQACATPVLCFPRGAAPEIVADGVTGFVCADVDEMVRAVEQLGRIDRAACRERVDRLFSIERMVDRHLALYESLLPVRSTTLMPA